MKNALKFENLNLSTVSDLKISTANLKKLCQKHENQTHQVIIHQS